MDVQKEKLTKLDKKADDLLKAGKLEETSEVLAEALVLRGYIFGETSDEYAKTAEKLCEIENMLSMKCLTHGDNEECLKHLKKAEMLSEFSIELRAVTYNNYGCYYRRLDKVRIALTCLQTALNYVSKSENSQVVADIHLNLCVVLSKLGKHDQAKDHVMQSVMLLQDEFMEYVTKGSTNNDKKQLFSDDPVIRQRYEDRVFVLAIAYHNLAVELEYLKMFDEALETYKKAATFAATHLGESHHVFEMMQHVMKNAEKQINGTRGRHVSKSPERKPRARRTGSMEFLHSEKLPKLKAHNRLTPTPQSVGGVHEHQPPRKTEVYMFSKTSSIRNSQEIPRYTPNEVKNNRVSLPEINPNKSESN
jgi:tetratricopeptide (TPR) repeat protein